METRMRRLLSLLVILPLLAGCVNMLAERQAYFGQFVGQAEGDLVRGLGVPSRTIDTDGHHFLAYSDRSVQLVPGMAPYYGWGHYGGWYGGGYPAGVIERICETTFEVVDGKVTGFTMRGNSCAW
jgi:hypothetical protein